MTNKYDYNTEAMMADVLAGIADPKLCLFMYEKKSEIMEMAELYIDHLFGDQLFMTTASPYMVKLKALAQSFCDAHPELGLTPGNEYFIPFYARLAGEFTMIYCEYVTGRAI